jgi:hypothetical protein
VLAVLAAVALVVGAVLIRNRIIDGNGGGGGGGDGGDGGVTLACVTELEEACAALADAEDDVEVVVEDAGTTLEKLTAGDSGYNGWLTFDPWPAVVAAGRPAQSLGDPGAGLAAAELLIAVPDNADPCGGPVTWRCLGENAAVNVGLPPPESALGLLLLGNAVSGYFGRTDVFTNDFEEPGFDSWYDNLTAADDRDDPLGALLLVYPPTRLYDAVGTDRAQFDASVPGSRADGRLDVAEPDPLASAVVVMAPVAGAGGGDRIAELAGSDALAEALADLGWDVGSSPSANLPDPGVLYALLTR